MRHFLAILFVCVCTLATAQNERPKLVVGIVVDQMRYDYLYRFSNQFTEGGFKRLLREGLSCENTRYNYIPTYTGPGHACIYTGTEPASNGIVGNDWYDREWGAMRYVTADPQVRSVGTNEKAGKQSPAVLLSTTITDELRLFSNFRSKVVGICLKDRGSILPAGHIPNGAYWFDDKTGNWITSSFYPDSLGLPNWVKTFNDRKLPETYCNRVWKRREGVNYEESFAGWAGKFDRAKYAASLSGGFPHNLAALRKTMGLGVLRFTPWGNTITLDLGLAALDSMALGRDQFTDFLCLSFSSTDYAGHQFGIHAEETQDVYIGLDQEMERLLKALDAKVGKDNYLVFLTADHGGSETPPHLKSIGVPGDVLPESKIDSMLTQHLSQEFGDTTKMILKMANQQIWFKPTAKASMEALCTASKNYLRNIKGIYDVHDRAEIMALPADHFYGPALRRGFHPRRSGDLYFHLDPNWHPDDKFFGQGGATHGSSYAYDTHVPLLWMGKGIRAGQYHGVVSVSDIAPTLSAILHINEPSASTGKVIERVLER